MTEILKKTSMTRFQTQSGHQAAIPQHPYRKRSPKHQIRVHVSLRVKKGPLESRG